MTLRSKHLLPIILGAFVVGIGGTIIFNLWQTTSSKVPVTFTSGDHTGQYNPGDIRGSYSFDDIEQVFDVSATDLAKAFGVEDSGNPAAFLCKGLEELYGEVGDGEIGTDSVRWFVALYTGLPYTPNDDTLLLSPALAVLKDRLSEAELKEVKTKVADLSGSDQTAEGAPAAGVPSAADAAAAAAPAKADAGDTHTETTDGQVRGKTTFGELLSWGVSREAIEKVIQLPIGKNGVTVRDYCSQNGIEFSTVKGALQELVDRVLDKQ